MKLKLYMPLMAVLLAVCMSAIPAVSANYTQDYEISDMLAIGVDMAAEGLLEGKGHIGDIMDILVLVVIFALFGTAAMVAIGIPIAILMKIGTGIRTARGLGGKI